MLFRNCKKALVYLNVRSAPGEVEIESSAATSLPPPPPPRLPSQTAELALALTQILALALVLAQILALAAPAVTGASGTPAPLLELLGQGNTDISLKI